MSSFQFQRDGFLLKCFHVYYGVLKLKCYSFSKNKFKKNEISLWQNTIVVIISLFESWFCSRQQYLSQQNLILSQ